MTAFDKEKTAFTVGSSESGMREQVFTGLVSASSIPEAAGPVKNRLGARDREDAHLRRLAAILTEKQKWDIIRLALVIEETKDTTARPRLLEYLKRNGLLERFLEAERGGKRRKEGGGMSPSVLAPETAAKSQTAEPDGWTGQERQDVVRLAFMIQWGGGLGDEISGLLPPLVAWCNRAYAWGKNDAGRSTS